MSSSLTDWSGCNAKGESFRISAHVVPTSGICESRTLFRAIEPAGIEPAGMEPAGIEPAGIEPAGIEPAGIEPAGADATSGDSSGSREAGIAEYGAEAMPAGIDDSSEVSARALTARLETLTLTCCAVPRGAPSPTAWTSNSYVPTAVPGGTVIVAS